MPRSFGLAAALLLVLAVVLAACGGTAAAAPTDRPSPTPTEEPETPEAADPTPGTALNACQILTADEVGEILEIDTPVADGELKVNPSILSPGHTECRYESDGKGVVVELTPEDGANLYDAARGAYSDAVDITGTSADGAFFSKKDIRTFIWKGSVTAMLTVFAGEGGWTYDRAKAFAEVILAKL